MISAIYLRNILNCGSIIREYEADTVYLLAKELAYDVVTGQTDNLAAALAKTSGKDIVQFAKAVGVSHPSIDGKVCKTKSAGKDSSQKSQYAMYKESTDIKSTTLGGTALCGDKGFTTGSNNISNGHSETPQFLGHFVAKTLKDGNLNWPTSSGDGKKDNDNAQAVAKDLVALNSDEKTIVAGLLAKTIEGGEVVEIRAVSSTFVSI
ncbi:putative p44-44 outer membrane protein, silent [Anaplasma phagocytophilum str. ApNP]|uniref:Putative p44-44 outer membrane protein, silent n=1 Tax=Anaplasma phagocytophilum str. ApNP TaxID=1359153 RepID=A0A0F3NM75_ANAPH|nr:putative p44-44 outer membrane protein, silent [Anaplasma phagocytophilum str. ApNP]